MKDPRISFRLLAIVAVIGSAACSGTDIKPPPGPAEAATITIHNKTGDAWFVDIGGSARGSVPPSRSSVIQSVAPGLVTLQARNDRLKLSQRGQIEVAEGGVGEWTIEAQHATLKVVNKSQSQVEILVDGAMIGRAAKGETVFDAVPAGLRTLIARSVTGPGAVQAERFLDTGAAVLWVLPDIGAAVGSGAPKPPKGQGLIWMKNKSSTAVTVSIEGVERATVAAGGVAEIIVAPGDHKLVVRLEGVDALSEHAVSLRPNQTAEWVYGE
ncbi:MAG: hypothetical protein ACI9MR_000300 [Myxococcota bacterium]|jgi:hypothetical protein